MRRLLVDYGQLERTPDGSAYRVGFPPASVAFDLEVDPIDSRATIAAYLDHQRRKPRGPRKPDKPSKSPKPRKPRKPRRPKGMPA